MDDSSDSKTKPSSPSQDMVLLHGRTEDGVGYRAVRAREGHLELAEVRPAREGQPLQGSELVALHPRPEFPLVCEVEVLYRRDEPGKQAVPIVHEHAGPARASNRSYRANWERTFRSSGKKTPRGPAN